MQIVQNNNKTLYVENGCYNSKCYNKNHVRVTWKFLGGGGVIKVPLGTEIPKGWGDANQKPSVGGVWIFSGTTHYNFFFDGITLSFIQVSNLKIAWERPILMWGHKIQNTHIYNLYK